jgi:hypothetical protein
MRVYTTDRYYMRGRGALMRGDPDGYVRGTGIASIFGRIFSTVVPLVKGALRLGSRAAKSKVGRSLAKEMKRSATQAGVNVVSDALKGKNIIDSSKKALNQVTENMGNRITSLASASTAGPKPPKLKRRPKRATKTAVTFKPKGGGRRTKKKKRGGTSKKKRRGGKKGRVRLSSLFN